MRYAIFPLSAAILSLALAGCNDESQTATGPGGAAGGVGLNVGNIAPPLEGTDLDGRIVRLSDHKGKVVVVDFWATWCPPCRAMIPHEKKLVKRLEGRPFVFLGVSADRTREDLASFLESDPLPWDNIFDGPRGTLTREWRIEYFPSIFIIDGNGVIRDRDKRGAEMDRAVDALLAELERKS